MERKYTTLPFTEYTTYAYEDRFVPVTQIIIHSTVGTVASAISTFSNPNATTSAHYIVGNDGRLWAGLEEYEVAYHSGNIDVNRRSIGIEHEWYQGMVISDKLYATSAKLVADICKFYGLSANRGVIKGHKEIVPTGCPNQIDVDRIVREASAILTPPTPVIGEWQTKLQKYSGTFYKPEDVIAFIEARKLEITNKDKVITDKDKIINTLNTKFNQIKTIINS